MLHLAQLGTFLSNLDYVTPNLHTSCLCVLRVSLVVTSCFLLFLVFGSFFLSYFMVVVFLHHVLFCQLLIPWLFSPELLLIFLDYLSSLNHVLKLEFCSVILLQCSAFWLSFCRTCGRFNLLWLLQIQLWAGLTWSEVAILQMFWFCHRFSQVWYLHLI